MKKQYVIAAIIIAALGATGYYYASNVSDKPVVVDISVKREMMQKRYNIHENMKNISKLRSEELNQYVDKAKEERLAEIQKQIALNTIFVKNNDSKLNKSINFDGEEVLVNRGDRLIKVEQVLNSDSTEIGLKVKKDYYDEDFLYIRSDDYITDVSELITNKIAGVDYNAYEKVYEYASNPRVDVKGVFITETSASNQKLTEMIELANTSEINAFVIDVKDDNGNILFYSEAAAKFNPSANRNSVKDMQALMKKLKDNNIYTIARIVAFKSPRYADQYPERAITYKSTHKIYDSNGLKWASAYDRQLWEYNVEVAKEAAKLGFNEIQFDYVRFPASGGGKLDKSLDYKNELEETKTQAIQNFLKYANDELREYEVYISADVFGWAASSLDDVGIGQQWEAISNVVDYICPMVYPSHYGPGNYGLSVPDAFPYETVYGCTEDAIERNENILTPATIRPWIQDFTAPWVKGHIRYGAKEVELQIKALEDLGINEYILWNAGNRYSEDALR